MSKSFLSLGEDATTIKNLINLAKKADDGWLNVLCHGEVDAIYIDRRKFKPESFAKYLKELGYEEGKKIRLVSCNTGAKPNGFAQKLANILNVEVEAPSDVIGVNDIGEFVIGVKNKGIMKIFKPQN